MDDIIRTENLTKHFGKVHAVDDLSLNIRQGEIYGFLGLNGAGKTTTIRMLLGMIRPTSGTSFIFGKQIKSNNLEIWEKVGYLVEIPYSYPDLTVKENLEITRRLRLVPDPKSVNRVIEKLHLGEYIDRKAKNLSQGNGQRLGLAKALIHNPDILLLDEPANALDPAGIVEIRELLCDMAYNKGVTIFISSHILDEVSKFATRIGIIHQGKLINEVDANKLTNLRQKRLLLNTVDNISAIAILAQNGYTEIEKGETSLIVNNEKAINHPEEIAQLLVKSGIPPTLIKVDEEDLESYFLRTIGIKGGEK